MLPYGKYIVHQSKGCENTEWMLDFEADNCENKKDYFYLINDALLTSYVKIVKKDTETGNVIPVSGIGFKVCGCTNSCYILQKINYPFKLILDLDVIMFKKSQRTNTISYIDSEENECCRMLDEYGREFQKKEQMCSSDRYVRTA